MSIDRIGKGGSPPVGGAATGTPSAGPTAETGKPFEVKRPDASAPAQPTSAVADTSPLEQLQVGKLDLDGYLNAKLEQATAHLKSVPKVQLEQIRTMLREQLSSDPALADLDKHATGQVPSTPEE